jgi:hypothetical protein
MADEDKLTEEEEDIIEMFREYLKQRKKEKMPENLKEKPDLRRIYREVLIRLGSVERDEDYSEEDFYNLLKEIKSYIDIKIYNLEQKANKKKQKSVKGGDE